MPTSVSLRRGKKTASTSIIVDVPGVMSKRKAPVVLTPLSSAYTVSDLAPGAGLTSQNSRKDGNSSPAGEAVEIAMPRADAP